MREAVYQRARAALARQLTAVDPPLSTREIERQHQELEDAVARLEAEYSAESESEADAPPDDDPFGSDSPVVVPAYRPDPVAREAMAPQNDAEPGYEDDEEGAEGEEDEDGDDFDEEERSSRLPLLAGLVVLVLVIGGAGAYVYTERDRLFGLVAASEDSGEAVTTIAPPPAEAEMPGRRDAKRAGRGGQAPRSHDQRDGANVAARRAPAEAEAEPEAPLPETALVEPPPEPEPPVAEEVPDAPPPEEAAPPAEEQTAALEQPQPGQSIVAQRAIFYFQGKEGSAGQATEGTATWAEITRENSPAIQATLRLADDTVSAQ